MEYPSYPFRWIWLGVVLGLLALLSPAAVLVGQVLWLWLHWKAQARWRWVVAGVLLLASWAGLVLLWDTLAGQLVALREANTGYTGLDTLLMRALPVWGEGTLLGPTIAGLVHLFRPQQPVRQAPAQQLQPGLLEEPAAPTPRRVRKLQPRFREREEKNGVESIFAHDGLGKSWHTYAHLRKGDWHRATFLRVRQMGSASARVRAQICHPSSRHGLGQTILFGIERAFPVGRKAGQGRPLWSRKEQSLDDGQILGGAAAPA